MNCWSFGDDAVAWGTYHNLNLPGWARLNEMWELDTLRIHALLHDHVSRIINPCCLQRLRPGEDYALLISFRKELKLSSWKQTLDSKAIPQVISPSRSEQYILILKQLQWILRSTALNINNGTKENNCHMNFISNQSIVYWLNIIWLKFCVASILQTIGFITPFISLEPGVRSGKVGNQPWKAFHLKWCW